MPVQPSHVSDDSLEEVQTLFEIAEEDPIATLPGGSETIEANTTSEALPVEKVTISILGEPSISIDDGAATRSRRRLSLLPREPRPGEWSSSSSISPPTTAPPPAASG